MQYILIAGLGNPGAEYDATRHNMGFRIIDAYARRHCAPWSKEVRFDSLAARVADPRENGGPPAPGAILVKPQTYMNRSGECLQRICRYYRVPVDSVHVIYDDVYLELGRIKISVRGSAGGHNGVENVMEHLGEDFVRFRIGIGPKDPPEMKLRDFVLSKFTDYQQALVDKKLPEYVEGLQCLVDRGPVLAMNHVNMRCKINEPDGNQE